VEEVSQLMHSQMELVTIHKHGMVVLGHQQIHGDMVMEHVNIHVRVDIHGMEVVV
jgi:hypothetical protein